MHLCVVSCRLTDIRFRCSSPQNPNTTSEAEIRSRYEQLYARMQDSFRALEES